MRETAHRHTAMVRPKTDHNVRLDESDLRPLQDPTAMEVEVRRGEHDGAFPRLRQHQAPYQPTSTTNT